MSRLQEKYQEEVVPQLKKEFGIKHNLAVPKLVKIVINIGIGSIKEDQPAIEQISRDLAALSGQKPVVTRAKRAISAFKLSKGQPVGLTVTLRGKRMYDFLDKLESIVLPKVRDFRGLPATSFDDQGNYTLGLKEQAIFPEVSFHGPQSDKIRGLEITIVTTAKNKEEGKKLLELLGMPFKKN